MSFLPTEQLLIDRLSFYAAQ